MIRIPTARPHRFAPLALAALALLVVSPALLFVLPGALRLPRYEVEGGRVVARSLLSITVVPAGTNVRRARLEGLVRVGGTAFDGYCTGNYRARGFSRLALYTDCSRDVLVFGVPGRPVALSPTDPDALLAARRSGRSGTFFPAPARVSWGSLLFVLPGLALVAFFARARLRYEVRGGELTVRTAWSALRFPLAETEVRRTSGRLGRRTFGTAFPGYFTGLFRFEGDTPTTVRALATSGRPDVGGVLLTRGGRTYFLTPREPDALVALVREGGGRAGL